MGVRTLGGTADGTTPAAAMYDSVTGWMLGPIFEGDDACEQIEAFLAWLGTMPYVKRAREIGFARHETPDPRRDATDPRSWPDAGLNKLVTYWRRDVCKSTEGGTDVDGA